MSRFADVVLSSLGLILLFPLLGIVGLCIALESKGGMFFRQERVGKDMKNFYLLKFRSMYQNAESKGQLTVGSKDQRITRMGYFIRKYKIDELPQLLNVIFGDMSLVGPRPEVPKYVNQYTEEQLSLLSIRPGITDFASLYYFEEADLLAESENPERTYIEDVLPQKLSFSLLYMKQKSLPKDIKVILVTIFRLFGIKINLIK